MCTAAEVTCNWRQVSLVFVLLLESISSVNHTTSTVLFTIFVVPVICKLSQMSLIFVILYSAITHLVANVVCTYDAM